MKYKIVIEGGFTGISSNYEGEIAVNRTETQKLFSALHTHEKSPLNMPDGQTYHVLLDDGAEKNQAVFNEKNVPAEIRKLIADVKLKSR